MNLKTENSLNITLHPSVLKIKRIVIYTVLICVILFSEIEAHDVSASVCYSQTVTEQNNFRLSIVRGSLESYRNEMASVNLIEDNSIEGKYYISTNTIAIMLTYFATETKWGDIFGYLLIPQMIGNMKFSIDIYSRYFQIIVGQTTDYYLHYKISRIFTASSVGIESHMYNFRIVTELQIPLSKGYRKDRSPFAQLTVGYFF